MKVNQRHVRDSQNVIELIKGEPGVVRFELDDIYSLAKFGYYVPDKRKFIFQIEVSFSST